MRLHVAPPDLCPTLSRAGSAQGPRCCDLESLWAAGTALVHPPPPHVAAPSVPSPARTHTHAPQWIIVPRQPSHRPPPALVLSRLPSVATDVCCPSVATRPRSASRPSHGRRLLPARATPLGPPLTSSVHYKSLSNSPLRHPLHSPPLSSLRARPRVLTCRVLCPA